MRGQNHKQEKGNKMKVSQFKDYSELPRFLNADMVAKVLGVSPSSGYELMHVVVTNSVLLALPQAAGLAHSVVPPLPTQPALLGLRGGLFSQS